MWQLLYQVCYPRYQVSCYLYGIGPVLKHCQVWKYYDQDYTSLLVLALCFNNVLVSFCKDNFIKLLEKIILSTDFHNFFWDFLRFLCIFKIFLDFCQHQRHYHYTKFRGCITSRSLEIRGEGSRWPMDFVILRSTMS